MKLRHAALPFALALLASLASCVSSPAEMDRQDSANLARLLEQGDSATLFKLSNQPFAVDQEIVVLPADIQDFWQAMCAGGLRLAPASADAPAPASAPINGESYRQFAASQDMKMFFSKYLDSRARILRLVTEGGQTLLIIVRNDHGKTLILGLKGPY